MRNQHSRQDLNQLITGLLQSYSQSMQQRDKPLSPHFMTRLQARISVHQATPLFWETGIINAQKWLVAFSLIAIIFFVSNLVFTSAPPMNYLDVGTDVPGIADHDWDHVSDELVQISDLGK